MKKITLFLLLLITAHTTPSSAQRIVRSLNQGWNFSYGWQVTHSPNKQELINIPHTWNLDALSGNSNYYRGLGNYLREFSVPSEWNGTQRVYLRFGGANTTAEVYLNGRRVGNHSGGYTAFGFDITSFLNFAGSNILWVRVSNAVDLNVMPLIGDFNNYGGIYRDVELVVTPNSHLSFGEYSASGIKVEQRSVTRQKASVVVNASLESWGDRRSARLDMKILDARDSVVASSSRDVRFGSNNHNDVRWAVEIENPRLWNGVQDPHMYRVVAEVSGGGAMLEINDSVVIARNDIVEQEFGLRFFEVNAANTFVLNGQPMEIRGVTRMHDNAVLGGAIHKQDMERDIEMIKEMGANAVRLSYFPSDSYFLELCDREGIIVWADLPFVGPGEYRDTGFNDSEEFRQNGIQQLSEMIAQQFNHPSVMFWGLYNELTQRGGDPLPYLRALNQIAKQEDPTRLTTAASNQDGELNFVTDLIGFNLYMGWKQGMPQDLEPWATAVRKDWPRLKVALSEYGAGASVYQFAQNGELKKPEVNSYWHPEQWQTYVHMESHKIIQKRKSFWGTFVSSMFDWGVANKRQGTRPGVSDLGLVTFDRAIKKDAFYYYKANWNTDDLFVHITTARNTHRTELEQTFRVFSNCQRVTLKVNGVVMGTKNNDGLGTFNFKDCLLQEGRNVVEAISSSGQRHTAVIYVSTVK